jgi:RNA-splicing ligase RtcB
MGTLGGGNHFIEACLEQGGDDAGRVWLMLHSGSRNIGKELASGTSLSLAGSRTTRTCPLATWRYSSPAPPRWQGRDSGRLG